MDVVGASPFFTPRSMAGSQPLTVDFLLETKRALVIDRTAKRHRFWLGVGIKTADLNTNRTLGRSDSSVL